MSARKRAMPAMNEVLWGLASLAVAGVAIAVIATPIVVGARRAARAVTRRLTSQRRDEQSSVRGTTRDRTATARPAVVAVAVPTRLTHTQLSGQMPDTYGVAQLIGAQALEMPARLAAESVEETPNGQEVPAVARDDRPMPRMLPGLTPLERAVWQGHERRGVPAVVMAEWEAGPLLVPGRYPLLPDEALLSREQLAELLAARGCPGWERSAVIAAHPLDPRSNAWN